MTAAAVNKGLVGSTQSTLATETPTSNMLYNDMLSFGGVTATHYPGIMEIPSLRGDIKHSNTSTQCMLSS